MKTIIKTLIGLCAIISLPIIGVLWVIKTLIYESYLFGGTIIKKLKSTKKEKKNNE